MTLLAAVLLAAASAGAASLHKWTDANGVTHFSTQPPGGGQPTETVTLRKQSNIVAPDSKNQFMLLAQVSAPNLCRGRRDSQSCVDAQISAARAVGELADGITEPRRRFQLQACQQRHMLSRSGRIDFIALRACVGGGN